MRPKGKSNHKVTEGRLDEQEVEVSKEYASNVDTDGAWKKRGVYYFGFKKYHVTDNEGLVFGILTTKANRSKINDFSSKLGREC